MEVVEGHGGEMVGAPTVGAPAPDAELRDAGGRPVRLSDLWPAAPRALALVFLRHFG